MSGGTIARDVLFVALRDLMECGLKTSLSDDVVGRSLSATGGEVGSGGGDVEGSGGFTDVLTASAMLNHAH